MLIVSMVVLAFVTSCCASNVWAWHKQKQDTATLDMERANKEIEVLRKQCEAMSQELKEAVQEAEVAKCRRDWAFQERDKIVAERESIRYGLVLSTDQAWSHNSNKYSF